VNLHGSVALVTGANRGIGQAFTRALLERGAARVYAGARDPGGVTVEGADPVPLDVTDPESVASAARRLRDVDLLVNNAGIARGAPLLAAPSLADARAEMEVNYFGTLAMARAFAPVLAAHGGGAIVSMLSALSFLNLPAVGSYAASKAAAWSLTNGIRTELAGQGTLVVGVHVAFVDTEMAARIDAPKVAPDEVVRQALDAVAAGTEEVLVDDTTRGIKAALPRDLELLYPDVRRQWATR
jgi:NAD(P)-dependent dehydrogenase (short-subunit alcohol dehydrogenase family)